MVEAVYKADDVYSGEHKKNAAELSSRRPRAAVAFDFIDIAPTVLKYFGVPIPPDIDGKSLF
jgi:bisphosphoglycerate-independent phosphoglycerate mutase (AlkP superfamily)